MIFVLRVLLTFVNIQVKIDAHLPCAAAAMHSLTPLGRLDLTKLVLYPEDAPQLATLPDLGPVIRGCLVARQWSSSYLAHLLHSSMPCTRPAVKVPAPDRASVAITLNLLLATLLGLYPVCVKRPPFSVRAAFYARVHVLLTSDADTQAAFVLAHQPLLSLSLSEYICHVLPAFLPAECSALCAAYSVDTFFTAGPPLFDVFRQVRVFVPSTQVACARLENLEF